MARTKYTQSDIRHAAQQLTNGEPVENAYLRRLARAYNQGTLEETGKRISARGHAALPENKRYYESPEELSQLNRAIAAIQSGSSKAQAARSVGLSPSRLETLLRHHERGYAIRTGKAGQTVRETAMHAGKPDIGRRLLSPQYSRTGRRVAGKHQFNVSSLTEVGVLVLNDEGEVEPIYVQVDTLNAQKLSIYSHSLVSGLSEGKWQSFDKLSENDRTIWALLEGKYYHLTNDKRAIRRWLNNSGLTTAELYSHLYKKSGNSASIPANR